jgi:hypothetical protein
MSRNRLEESFGYEDSSLDNWTWGLSLIALTIATHATGVTFMVSVLHTIRIRLESRSLSLPYVFAIVISAICVMGLLLAVLHGIEAALWAAAYVWLGAVRRLDGHARRFRGYAATALAADGRAGGG